MALDKYFVSISNKLTILNDMPCNVLGIENPTKVCPAIVKLGIQKGVFKTNDAAYQEERIRSQLNRSKKEGVDGRLKTQTRDLLLELYGLHKIVDVEILEMICEIPIELDTVTEKVFRYLVEKNHPDLMNAKNLMSLIKKHSDGRAAIEPLDKKKNGINGAHSLVSDDPKIDQYEWKVNSSLQGFNIKIPTNGWFYLLNEGPDGTIHVLFPSHFSIKGTEICEDGSGALVPFPHPERNTPINLKTEPVPGIYHIYGICNPDGPLPFPCPEVSHLKEPYLMQKHDIELLFEALNEFDNEGENVDPPWYSTYSQYTLIP